MASQLTATLPSAGPRLVCSPLCAALPEPHDFRLAPLAIQLQLGPKTNTKAQVAGSSDPWLVEFATDSPLEEARFEMSVPHHNGALESVGSVRVCVAGCYRAPKHQSRIWFRRPEPCGSA